jgi:universal stress protein E
MGDYRKIFLIVDPSREPTPAFRRAVRLARASGAQLHLGLYERSPALTALGLVNLQTSQRARDAFRVEREQWLDGVARTLTGEGVLAFSEVELRTPAHEAIAARVLALAPDLVLKDVQHEPTLARVLFTPFDAHLLRLCPAPLMLVAGRNDRWPRRVIAAVDTMHEDPDGLNERIVREALRLALQFDGEVHLVHVFEGLPPMGAGLLDGIEGFGAAYDELAQIDRDRFDAVARRHGVPAERKHLLPGFGPAALADFARDVNADLLVLGTNYRTGLDRLLVGSTAERLLGEIRCDVLAVHPDGFAADLERHLGLAHRASRQAA